MPNKVLLKKSSVAAKVPVAGDLDYGEIALNYQDGKIYYKKADNSIDSFTSTTGSISGVSSVAGNTGAVTATQLLTAINTVDGSGSGLDADLLDGINGASLIRSDTADTFLDITSENGIESLKVGGYTTTTAIQASYSTSFAAQPMGSEMWHDLLAFTKNYTTTYETYNGTAWSSATVNKELFAQKENQSIVVINATTILAARWTFTNVAYGSADWLVIGHAYSGVTPNKTVLVESSVDGVTWSAKHTSTYNNHAVSMFHRLNPYYGDAYLRVTITWVSGGDIRLSNIKLLTCRPGDQGRGSEQKYPYIWDGDQNITTGGNLTIGAGKTFSSPTTIVSTLATGTAPFTVASTTLVSNLNADLLDGYNIGTSGSAIPLLNTANTWSATQTIPTLAGNTQITGGLTVSGSVASGGGDYAGYRNAGTNLVLKGDSVGRSGIFFESEKDGVGINHPTDHAYIQFHSYGIDGSIGESNRLVIGVANDSDDFVVLQSPYKNGVKISFKDATSGANTSATSPEYTVWHAGNDGTGSGLDADLLDGLNSSVFLRNDVLNQEVQSYLTINTDNGFAVLEFEDASNVGRAHVYHATASNYLGIGVFDTAGANRKDLILNQNGTITWNNNAVWHAGNDGTGSGLDADLLDGLNSTAFAQLSGSTFTGAISGTSLILSGDSTTTGTITNVKNKLNSVTANLGNPTVEEMALFPAQFNNKLRFTPANLQEQSTDGITWITSTRLTANQLADLMLGEGQYNNATVIPTMTVGGSGYYRLTWDSTTYVYLNALYIYGSTQGNSTTYKVEAYHNTNGWTTIATGIASTWPGHVYIPHTVIPFNPSNVNQYGKVRLTASVVNATNAQPLVFAAIDWMGGYPAGQRNVETYDRSKNVTFPAGIFATNAFSGTGATFTSSFGTGFGQIKLKSGTGTTGYGVIHRHDGSDYYLLVTANNDADGSWTTARPLTIGLASGNIGLGVTTAASLTVTGDLTVNGTTTTINSTTVSVDDKNIELGSVASPTNTTADGGGITLKGTTDKTFNWVNATSAWTSSEDLNLLTGKQYEINGTAVLSATALGSDVTGSSLTSVGTIGTGVWQGTSISTTYTDAKVTAVAGNTGAITATQLLTAINTVDGTGSGLDADLLDGQQSSYYLDWTNINNKPDPVITLAGDLTGSVTLTDLASGTLTATIAANSVALGTDTTGNYVASMTAGNGITVGTATGEGSTPVITNTGVLSVDGNTGAVTATQLLTSIKTVDGTGSGLDADLLGGVASSSYVTLTGTQTLTNKTLTGNVNVNSSLKINSLDGYFTVQQNNSSWTTSTDHPIIKWNYNATYDDHLYLASGGNQAVSSQSVLVISENSGLLFGKGDNASVTTLGTKYFQITNTGNVGIGNITTTPSTRLQVGVKVSDDNVYTYDANSLYVVHQTGTSTTVLNDPKEVLLLGRQGTSGQAFGAAASFRLSRYENSGTNSRTRLDLVLAHDSFINSPTTVLTARSDGNVGIGTTAPAYKLQVNGSFAATTKSFVIDHPTKPDMKLRYGSLEGPENGVYVRGRLKGNKIELPDYWTKLVDPESITVSLTSVGKHQDLYVKSIENNTITVANSNLVAKGIDCFYVVYGERCDVDKLEVEI